MRIYFSLMKMYLKSTLEYRMAFFFGAFANIIRKVAEYLSIWILLSSFNVVGGWKFYDVLMLYNINQFAISFSGMIFWSPMLQLESLVHNGNLDTLMTKPIGLFSHLLCRTFDLSFLANLSLSIVIFIYYFITSDIVWSPLKIFMFIIIIIAAILIYSSMHIFIGSLSFWVTKIGSVFLTIMNLRKFVFYPITIYNEIIKVILTYVFPIAFVNYYPMLYLLDKSDEAKLPLLVYPLLSLGIGIIMFVLSYMVFNIGSKRYVSTGN